MKKVCDINILNLFIIEAKIKDEKMQVDLLLADGKCNAFLHRFDVKFDKSLLY